MSKKPKSYWLSFAANTDLKEYTCPRKAGAAFAAANVDDKPRVISSDGTSASMLARTMTIGDTLTKSLPFETAPEFVEGFFEKQ